MFNYSINNIKSNNYQTEINLLYQVENLKENEIDLFKLVYFFLDSKENNLILKKLRYELNLVYTVYTSMNKTYGYYRIIVYTKLENKQKIIDGINEVFKEIKNIIDECKNKLIDSLKFEKLLVDDDPYKLLLKEMNSFLKNKSIDEEIKIYQNINIISFIKKIKLTKIICIEGEKND